MLMLGCEGSLQKMREPGSSSDTELGIANLASQELQNTSVLYGINYTNLPEGEQFMGIRLASGRVLAHRDGRFKFEQTSSEPTKAFLIHFDPNGNLLIVFPRLKKAFRAPADILTSPQVLPVLAAYDGLRILMGLGEIWSDPNRSQFRTRGRGGMVVEQTDRPFTWNVKIDTDGFLFPIEELEAKSRSRTVLSIAQDDLSYERLDYSSGNVGGIPGQDVRGAEVRIKTWVFKFSKSPGTTEIQMDPLGGVDPDKRVAEGGLNAPDIPSNFEIGEISPVVLLNWLNIR